jgi:hypothetical protein
MPGKRAGNVPGRGEMPMGLSGEGIRDLGLIAGAL